MRRGEEQVDGRPGLFLFTFSLNLFLTINSILKRHLFYSYLFIKWKVFPSFVKCSKTQFNHGFPFVSDTA